MLKKGLVYIVLFTIVFPACRKTPSVDNEYLYSAYKPVLMDEEHVYHDLFLIAPKEKINITKVMPMGNYLLALDFGLGLHIYDITDINNPSDEGFYQIPACIDFEVHEQMVYANNHNDFIMVDFTILTHPVIVKRVVNQFDIHVTPPDAFRLHKGLSNNMPKGPIIISYEKL